MTIDSNPEATPASHIQPPDRLNEIGVLKRREIEARIVAASRSFSRDLGSQLAFAGVSGKGERASVLFRDDRVGQRQPFGPFRGHAGRPSGSGPYLSDR